MVCKLFYNSIFTFNFLSNNLIFSFKDDESPHSKCLEK